jgi:ABC-type glycerol-3-phosphate transport system substrate-binding protein
VTITITKITAARAAAVIIAGAAIAACAAPAPRPAATDAAKRAAKPAATPALTTAQGKKICDDLNAWLAGAWNQKEPRFNTQMESDETEAGYTALGSDLMTLDWNLVNFNSSALQNSPPDYYPVTGLAALQDDCAGYGVSVKVASG